MAPRLGSEAGQLPHKKTSLRLVLFYIGVDDAGDVVFIFLDFLEQIVVFLFLVFTLFFELLRLGRFRLGGLAFLVLVLAVGLHHGLGLGGFLLFDLLVLGLGAFLGLLVLGLLEFFILGLDHYRLGWFGYARAPLLQQHLRLKG